LAHPSLTPKAVANVTALLLAGDGGELETDKHGKLRERFGTRGIAEVVTDYLRQNPHFLGSDNAKSAPAASKLDRATMTAKEKGQYIEAHGSEKYLALPHSKDVKK
jgi:hypothetical protein